MFSCYLGCQIRNEIWGSDSGLCWDVALCRWWAVGMWHCVVGERISALRGCVVHWSWEVKQSKNKYFCFETLENLHLIRYSVWYWKSWTVSKGVLVIGRNEKWYIRFWCRTLESGEFKEGGGRCLSCGSGEVAELSASTGCVESILTSAYFWVSETVTVA